MCFQVRIGCVSRTLAVFIQAEAFLYELTVTRKHLAFQTERADDTVLASGNRIYMSRITNPVRNDLSATSLRNTYVVFIKGLVVNVGEVHIIELHAADLLQLLLYPAAQFQ